MHTFYSLKIFALVTFGLPMPNVYAQSPQIITVGIGEIRTPPDSVVIMLAVETIGTNAERVGRENATRMAELRRGLEKFGIPPTNISNVGYFLRTESRLPESSPREVQNRFVARNGIRVTVTDIDRVGKTIDIALASGANQVEDLAFRASEERDLRLKALSLAVAQARVRAEAIAKATGGKLGPLIEVSSEEGVNMFAPRMVAETDVSRAEITITERVIARWQFVSNAP